MRKPRLTTIANYFKDVKSIRCMKNNILVDVTKTMNYRYNKEDNSYTSISGSVMFWKDGVYAEIGSMIKKCNKCKKCNCNEKK